MVTTNDGWRLGRASPSVLPDRCGLHPAGEWPQRIVEYLTCFQKAYAVFVQVAGRLVWVPIKVQIHG